MFNASFPVDHDVGRFRSRWHDAGVVRGESPSTICAVFQVRGTSGCPLLGRSEIAAWTRHREYFSRRRHKVWMRTTCCGHLAREQQLLLEPLSISAPSPRRVPRRGSLQRDSDAELRVPAWLDLAHTADAEEPMIYRRAERLARHSICICRSAPARERDAGRWS